MPVNPSSSNLYSGSLATQFPSTLVGANIIPFSITVALTDTQDVGDILRLCPLAPGDVPVAVYIENADLDTGTGTLRTDFVQTDDSTTTVLLADSTGYLSTARGSGAGAFFLLNSTPAPSVRPGVNAYFGLKVTAGSNAGAGGTVKGFLLLNS